MFREASYSSYIYFVLPILSPENEGEVPCQPLRSERRVRSEICVVHMMHLQQLNMVPVLIVDLQPEAIELAPLADITVVVQHLLL